MWTASVHDEDCTHMINNFPPVKRKALKPSQLHRTNQIWHAPAGNPKQVMRPACSSMPGLTKTVMFPSDKSKDWEFNCVEEHVHFTSSGNSMICQVGPHGQNLKDHDEPMFQNFDDKSRDPMMCTMSCLPTILQDQSEPLFENIDSESINPVTCQVSCLPAVLKDHHEQLFQEMSVESSDSWPRQVSDVPEMVKDLVKSHQETLFGDVSIDSSNSMVCNVGGISTMVHNHDLPLFQIVNDCTNGPTDCQVGGKAANTSSGNSMKCHVNRNFHMSAISRNSSMDGPIWSPAMCVEEELPLFQELSCSSGDSTKGFVGQNIHMNLKKTLNSTESVQKNHRRAPMDSMDMMSTLETLPTIGELPTLDRLPNMGSFTTKDQLPTLDQLPLLP